MAFQTVSFVVTSLLLTGVFGPVASDDVCGAGGIACFGIPVGCKDAACDVSAKAVPSVDGIRVELSATSKKLKLVDRWIAVGFSADGQMMNAPVVHCFEQGGQAVSKLTFNSDKDFVNVGWADIDQSQLKPVKTSVDSNGLSCVAVISKKVSIKGLSFDLGQKHSLILATGPMAKGSVAVHDVNPESSFPAAFDFK